MSTQAKLLAACAATVTALLLGACGGSGKGLIPAGNAGPLRRDFEAVARDAAKGHGNCTVTERAIATMKHHFSELPGSIDVALREKLEEGIENLSAKAHSLCEQPPASATATSTNDTHTTSATSTATTSSETETEATETVGTETQSSSSTPVEPPSERGASGETPESGGTGIEAAKRSEDEATKKPEDGASKKSSDEQQHEPGGGDQQAGAGVGGATAP
ncbi:MAG: hypothetical protein ACYCUM_00150 [Solirubrobacteraceae bacterium]